MFGSRKSARDFEGPRGFATTVGGSVRRTPTLQDVIRNMNSNAFATR